MLFSEHNVLAPLNNKTNDNILRISQSKFSLQMEFSVLPASFVFKLTDTLEVGLCFTFMIHRVLCVLLRNIQPDFDFEFYLLNLTH